jgi:excisionase family DNA binding protein
MGRHKKAVTVQKTLLSVAEVAAMLGVCRTTVYTYIYSEGLPSMLLRGVRRIHPDSLEKWLAEREHQIA